MALSIEEELDKLKLDRDELTRQIEQLEKRLEYKSASKIFSKIQRLIKGAKAANLKVVSIKVSDDVHRVLEYDFAKYTRASVDWAIGGETFIMGIPVKVDKSCYETITLEVTADEF